MDEPPPIPEKFKDVDYLAWIIVGDIFTANGIRMTEDEDDPLFEALSAELKRRVAAMQHGRGSPTAEEQLDAARRLRGYGCWMYPHDPRPQALELFTETAHEWHHGPYPYPQLARRPYPDDARAQLAARASIALLHAEQPIEEEPAPTAKKHRRAKKPSA